MINEFMKYKRLDVKYDIILKDFREVVPQVKEQIEVEELEQFRWAYSYFKKKSIIIKKILEVINEMHK